MYPPIFAAVDVAPVRALLKTGNGPLRFYLFGEAPQGVAYPYAVWRIITGTPENYLGDRTDADSTITQVDVYASPSQGPTVARGVAEAIRSAVESVAHVTSLRGESRDPETQSWTSGFDVTWIVDR